MKFLARVVATVILGSLLFIQAFAEDTANSSNSTSTEATAPNTTGSSTAYLAPFIPMQADTTAKPKAKPPAMVTLIRRLISSSAIPTSASGLTRAQKKLSTHMDSQALWLET